MRSSSERITSRGTLPRSPSAPAGSAAGLGLVEPLRRVDGLGLGEDLLLDLLVAAQLLVLDEKWALRAVKKASCAALKRSTARPRPRAGARPAAFQSLMSCL
jgi:hypothetical protein